MEVDSDSAAQSPTEAEGHEVKTPSELAELDDAEEVPKLTAREHIEALARNEQRIASLPQLAGDMLAALTPAAGSDIDTQKRAVDNAAREYFATLNDVQLSLRSAIRQLRIQRASALPVLDLQGGQRPGQAVLATGDNELGEAALGVERDSWRDLNNALKALAEGDMPA